MEERAPRVYGRPLDEASARHRALQAGAMAHATHVEVLGAVAIWANGVDVDTIVAEVGHPRDAVSHAIAALEHAGLVGLRSAPMDLDAAPRYVPTADALSRFGWAFRSPSAGPHGVISPAAADAAPPVPRFIVTVTDDLAAKYGVLVSRETAHRLVLDSYRRLSEHAVTTSFLATLTERLADDRLSALARSTGRAPRGAPEVLFVCVRNAGRSQIAAALLRHRVGDAIRVRTAGSAPASRIDPNVREVLAEWNVPLALEFPKPLTDEVVRASDVVVTMGCGDACPVYPGRRYEDWQIEDPVGLDLDAVRRVRDEISGRIDQLAASVLRQGTDSPIP